MAGENGGADAPFNPSKILQFDGGVQGWSWAHWVAEAVPPGVGELLSAFRKAMHASLRNPSMVGGRHRQKDKPPHPTTKHRPPGGV